VSPSLSGRVGSALAWRTVQFGFERGLSTIRFLILARLLAPDDFGLLAIATVVVDLLMALTNLGLEPALVQLQHRRRRHYDAAWTVAVLRGAVISGAMFLGADAIASLYGEPRATPLLQLMALRPLLSGLSSPRLADLERELAFRALAMLIVASSVLQTLLAIGLAPVIGVEAVVVAMLAATLTHSGLSYLAAPHLPRFRLDRGSTGPLLSFGRWILATSIITILGEAALRGVVSRYLGASELGLYYLAFRLAYLPAQVVSTVVGSVAFPLHTRLRNELERAGETLATNVRALVAVLVPTYVVLIALVGPLTRDVLGPQWHDAQLLIGILAATAALGLIADSVFPMFEGRGEPNRITFLLTIRTAVVLVAAVPLTSALGVMGAAVATLLAEAPLQVTAVVLARRRVPGPFRGVMPVLIAAFVAGAIGGAVGLGLDALVGPPWGAIPAAVGGGTTAVAALWALDRVMGLRLATLLTQVFPALTRFLRPRDVSPPAAAPDPRP
jgi:O-antigen/teichoic acid export membrane protein